MAYTIEQWEADMTRLSELSVDPAGKTALEWADHIGRGASSTRQWIRHGIELGKMRLVGMKQVSRIDGRQGGVPAYAIVE